MPPTHGLARPGSSWGGIQGNQMMGGDDETKDSFIPGGYGSFDGVVV